ncbi:MAG: hypothetical protein H0X45_05075 [Planctomycetes bacterium]|nr:hypothetical protein [Planctomycetota bacterium]
MTRCGVALLAALAATVILLAALGAMLAALMAARVQVAELGEDERLLDLIDQGEGLASAWIATEGSSVVLLPAGGSIPILRDLLRTGEGEGELTIILYDGCAGVTLGALRSPLRLALPSGWQGIDDRAGNAGRDAIETIPVSPGLRRFPSLQPMAAVAWTEVGLMPPGSPAERPSASAPALAEVISPHSAGRINLNTAPADLLRLAFQELGLGGIDEVLKRRERGEPSTAPAQREGASLRLVASSDIWHALIVARWQGVERARWTVFGPGNGGALGILQRHDADR